MTTITAQNVWQLMAGLRDLTGLDRSEIMEVLEEDGHDITVRGWRFIEASHIDDVMREELAGDPYILGCFSADAISYATGVSSEAIRKMQAAEAYEGIGEMLLSGVSGCGASWLERLQEYYVRFDGYGHHFAQYDGEEHEVYAMSQSVSFYVFKLD